ncbi:MAG: dephospho-CoA kinase [Flammeovirgaceae bacterium]
MTKLLQIGITGGIGSGKSLICKIFQTLGVPIYDADSRAKWLMANDKSLIAKIKEAFGEAAYLENGEVNRVYLAQKVFRDGEQVKLLNRLVHPKVGEDSMAWSESWRGKVPYVIREAALMFESGSYKRMDKNITVFAPIDVRIARVLNRDTHRNEQQIRAIISKQMSEEERQQLADYVIRNDESELVIPQVLKLHEEFLRIQQVP